MTVSGMFHVKHSREEKRKILRNREEKIARAAHIKRNTEGTSNEISLSVLDAAKNAMDVGGQGGSDRRFPRIGSIPLFTLGKKKPVATPSKESEITLPSSAASSSAASAVSASSAASTASAPSAASLSGSSSSLSSSAYSLANSTSLSKASFSEDSVLNSVTGSDSASSLSGMGEPSGAPSGLRKSEKAGASTKSLMATQPAWETPFDEVARRKTKRRRYKRMVFAVVALVLVGMLASGAVVLFDEFKVQQDKREQLSTYAANIEDSTATVQPFYDFVGMLIQTPLDQLEINDLNKQYSETSINIEQEQARLDETRASLEELEKEFSDPNDSEAANQALTAIHARLNMLEAGNEIAKATIEARTTYDQADQAWQNVLAADVLARDAAALASAASVENMQQSTEKSTEALSLFSRAKEDLLADQDKLVKEDLNSYIDYIDLRIEAQNKAITSNQAYLDRDKETLAEATESYNALEEEAAALAKTFSGEPSSLVVQDLNEKIGDTASSYQTESARAADADTFLSDYLGRITK